MSDRQQTRFGRGDYVDSPFGSHEIGYLARWEARQIFLQEICRIVPEALTTLLTEANLRLVFVPAMWSTVTYPAEGQLVGNALESVLFDRNDHLFQDVDWSSFDPETHPDMELIPSLHRAGIRKWGSVVVAKAWLQRTIVRTNLEMSVKDALRFWTFSHDDGQLLIRMLKVISPDLLRNLTDWLHQWHLESPWMYMVACDTIYEAADAWTQGESLPHVFSVRFKWREWYENLEERSFPSSSLLVSVNTRWNPRIETRTQARQRIYKALEAELNRVEDIVSDASHLSPIKTELAHFEWLVRYQVLHESQQYISKRVFRDRATVSEALKLTTELIELPLRQRNSGGRPIKNTNKRN
jgi:hypothetical protein